MAKVGRPRAMKERRDMVVCVRFTLSEYRYLKALSMQQRNIPVSEVVRPLALVGMPAEEVPSCPVGTVGGTLAPAKDTAGRDPEEHRGTPAEEG